MTPTERLQAAIDKLEQHTGETWYFASPSDAGLLSRQGWIDAINPAGEREVLGLVGPGDAELIVTLHRTIDAQLSLLRHAKDVAAHLRPLSYHELAFIDDALNLADAILGTPALAEGVDR